MRHHADFAIPVTQPVEVSAMKGEVVGRVIALGWWVDSDAASRPDHEPTGTLYLVVDDRHARPIWVAQGDLDSVQMVSD